MNGCDRCKASGRKRCECESVHVIANAIEYALVDWVERGGSIVVEPGERQEFVEDITEAVAEEIRGR